MGRRIRTVLLLLAAAHAADGHAAKFCVSDSAQLQSALATAGSNNESDDIRLQIGGYSDAALFVNAADEANALTISGGWISFIQACDTQFPDASLTRFQSANASRGLAFTLSGTTPGAVTVSNLTVQDAANSSSAGIVFNVALEVVNAPQLTVNNVVVRNCISTSGVCGVYFAGPARVLARNVLVADSNGARSSGIGVTLNFANGPIHMNHVTVTNNKAGATSGSYAGLLVQAAAATAVVSNSIVWNNQGQGAMDCDVGVTDFPVRVINSTIQTPCAGALAPTSINVTNLDPQFVSATDFRLAGNSPARDVGQSNPIGGLVTVDLDGRNRTLGSNPDLGAFESAALFANGFE